MSLGIVFTTYNRAQTAVPALKALAGLRYDGDIRLWLCDDGTGSAYTDSLCSVCPVPVTVIDAGGRGVGHSKNLGLARAFAETDTVLLMEDDWVLQRDLDVNAYVKCLRQTPDLGIIRLGWLSVDISARLVGVDGVCYWDLVPDSGVYGCSGQVSLRHKRFYDVVGYHGLGMSPGEEELDMCSRWNRCKSPRIFWPADIPCGLGKGVFANNGLGVSLNRSRPRA